MLAWCLFFDCYSELEPLSDFITYPDYKVWLIRQSFSAGIFLLAIPRSQREIWLLAGCWENNLQNFISEKKYLSIF